MKLVTKWKRLKDHWRYKYVPRVSGWLLDLSTLNARRVLKGVGSISVLIDNTILFHGITHETTWISKGTLNWGETKVETGHSARLPVHAADDDSEEYGNIKYLAGIAHLARRGTISLKTSAELQDERIRQPSGRFTGYGHFDYNVFSGITIESVDGHAPFLMGPRRFNFPKASAQQRTRLDQSGDSLYEALVAKLGPRNSQDAWHIRTAELHGAHCFLTMDFKLLRTLASLKGQEPLKSLRTLILTPEQFGKRWGMVPLPPYILSYNDASFFVRPDLHLPNSKRRPLKAYRANTKSDS